MPTGKGGPAPAPGIYHRIESHVYDPKCNPSTEHQDTLRICSDTLAQTIDDSDFKTGGSFEVAIDSPNLTVTVVCPVQVAFAMTYETNGDVFTTFDGAQQKVHIYKRQP